MTDENHFLKTLFERGAAGDYVILLAFDSRHAEELWNRIRGFSEGNARYCQKLSGSERRVLFPGPGRVAIVTGQAEPRRFAGIDRLVLATETKFGAEPPRIKDRFDLWLANYPRAARVHGVSA